MIAAGTCTIQATQAGNGVYAAGCAGRRSVLVSLLTTTTVAAVSGENAARVNLSATIGPAGAVFSGMLQFQVQGANVGSPVPVTGAGIYTLPYTITQTGGILSGLGDSEFGYGGNHGQFREQQSDSDAEGAEHYV